MQQIDVSASPAQLSRLRNGHRVRVHHGAIQGQGVVLLVDPAKFSQMTRSFARGQAATISLSEAEMQANADAAQELGGSGLFAGGNVGKKIRGAFKKVGKAIVKSEAAVRASPFGRTVVKTVLPLAAKLAITAAAQRAGMDPATTKELSNAGSNLTHSGLVEAGYGMSGAGKKKSLMRRIGRKQIRSVTKELGRAAKTIFRDVVVPAAKSRLQERLASGSSRDDQRNFARQVGLPWELDPRFFSGEDEPSVHNNDDYARERARSIFGDYDYNMDDGDYARDDYSYSSGYGLYASGRGLPGPPSRLPASSTGSVGVSGSLLAVSDHPALRSDPSGANLLMNTGLPPRNQKGGYHLV